MTDGVKSVSSISLAEKSAAQLRRYIQANFPNGGRIPGEHELAELLGVNRGTLRQSLQILEQEGLIIRRHGSGTYANQYVLGIRMRLESIVRFTELVARAGYEPTRRQLSWEVTVVEDDVAEQCADRAKWHGEHHEKRLIERTERNGEQRIQDEKQGDAAQDRLFSGFLVLGHIAGVAP